jgi:putative adhesin
MRKTSLRPIPVLAVALLAAASGLRAESVHTLKVELSGAEAAHFAVENLVGRLRISAGSGSTVEIVATVYGESDDLAGAVRLERVPGEGATVRVRYPYDRVKTFRYRAPSDHDSGFWGGDWSSADQVEYDGRRVSVSHRHGTTLYADLDVRVPASRVRARFVQKVGLVEAEHLQGDLAFAVASADLRLRALEGSLNLEGSSGDVRARDVKGTWTSDFTSGDCDLVGFEGDALTIRTTSGDASLRSVKARRAELESTSGDFRLVEADLQELSAEANSGDIAFEAAGASLRQARIRTSSGDVSLRLPSDSSFDVEADQSSGDMDVRFSDGSVVNHRDRTVGYRHGSGGAHIRVRTSSGDLTVSPS